MPCFLCTQPVDGAVGNIEFASGEADSLGLRKIVETHFWLRTGDSDSGYVCGACWEQLLLFHNFYLTVEQAHRVLEAAPPTEVVSATVVCEGDAIKTELAESVAASVKRRRGRNRKSEALISKDANDDLKCVLEQINLNEIKIEFPEADLTIADVLDDQDQHDFMPSDSCGSQIEEGIDDEEAKTERKRKVRGRPRGSARGRPRLAERRAKASAVPNLQKSQEFNDYIREHYKVQCPICATPMEGFSEMLVHVRREHNQRGFSVCCGRKFWKRGVLVDHLRRHQDPELFKCNICNRVMGQRRSLELHMRMHEIKTRGRLYQCEHCSKSFFSSVVCERHKLTHIPREQWQVKCTNCEKT